MGCGASVQNVVEEKKEEFGKKIVTLEDEMRSIQLEINNEEKIVARLKVQNRVQEAAQHLNKIKTLKERLNRTRRRIAQADRNKETLDKKMDLKEDIDDLKETEKVSNAIKVDYQKALKTHDNLRKMEDEIDTFSDMITDTANESDVLNQVTEDVKTKQLTNLEVEKKDESQEGFQVMQLAVDYVRAKKWKEVNKLCNQCITLNYDLKQSFWMKGKSQYHLEAYTDSIISITKSIEQHNDNENGQKEIIKKSKKFYLRGMCYVKENKGDEAKKDFMESLKLNQRNWKSNLEMGKMLYGMKENELAQEYLRKAYGFSNYECTEANELLKKMKKSDLKVVESKKEELKKENAEKVKILTKEEVKPFNIHTNADQKYMIQSMELPKRVLTVNLGYVKGKNDRNEVVLYNRVGNSLNQLWTFKNGYIRSCYNGKYLSADDESDAIFLTSSKKKKFTILNKFIVLEDDNEMCIDIAVTDNPYNTKLEMDEVGAGQRSSQYYKFIPIQIMSKIKKERQKIFVEGEKIKIEKVPVKLPKQPKQPIKVPQIKPGVVPYVADILGISNKGDFNRINQHLSNYNYPGTYPGINRFNTSNGNTALVNAIAANRNDTVRLLLLKGANPNQPNIFGATPLHICISWQRPQTIMLLRSAGGNPLLLDFNGLNCFAYVKKMKRPDFYYQLLQQPLN